MLKPGSALWLLRHEMRISWRNWFAATRARGRSAFVVYAILGALLLFGGYWAAQGLSETKPDVNEITLGVIGGIFLLLFTFMVAQALMLITEALYQRGDIDLLLASPLPPWRILIVRMTAVALNVATLYLFLVGAVFVWLPFFGGWQWMGLAPTVLALALLATAAALLLARVLFRVVGPKTTRVAAQILASLIGAVFFLAMQSQNYAPVEQRAQVYRALMARLAPMFGDAESPLSVPARAALGQPVEFGAWILIALGAYLFAVWWFASRFIANAAAIAGLGAARRRVDARVRQTRGGVGYSLVRKEWRLIARDPLLLSQILLPLLYFIPLFFVFGARLSRDGMEQLSLPGYASAFVLIATTLAASLAWLTVSAEDAPELIAAAPVSRDQIETAKALAAGGPVVALMLAPAVAASFLDPLAGVWLMIGSACAIASACLIAIWYQQPGSRKNFRRRTRAGFLVNIGQAFVTLSWVSATGLCVAGWAIAAIIPALIAIGLLLALHESRRKPG
jgi:ABC-2 type transport system permease protein